MKCDQCQFDNPDNMSFCGQCGARLERVCPGCGLANPPEFKFCGGCGHDLTAPVVKELSPDEKLARIQRYLPQNLTEKILAQRGRIEGEKREVTVMFCDMAGYTTLAESLGPERTFQVMDRVYETLIHQVHDFGGTVNELTGDGIMALFGAPIALEDAPQRALRAALAVHRALDALGLEDGADGQERPDLRMRIGVHSGPVVVGTLGNDLRVEFKAVGDTVNLASRMEGLAEPGTTYVTGATFKLTEGFFEFEPLGQRPVKGRVEPVSVFRLIGPTATRTRFDVSAERGLTALVGREREIELLRDGLDRALSGRGQAFSIVAEAGLGKSRLLHEFRQTLAGQDVTFLEGKCLSYSRGVAFHPHVDLLRSNFRLRDGETDAQVRDKVQKGLAVLGADDEATRPYILELMSARDSGVDQSRLSPEAIKDRMIEAMKRIVLTGSELRPLVLAYEDLHWADKTSAEVFGHLIETIPGARVMVIFTYRPEFTPAWGVKSYHHQITLNRLTRRETLTMVSRLLGTDGVAPDLEDLILDKSEGIPFFIEEYLRSLRELNIIARDDDQYRLAGGHGAVTIPSTIQDVILARVDTLDEGTKEVLQNASAIEREFGYELLRRVTGLAERELRSRLAVLKDAELVYERGLGAEASFLFKHALTQEAVYGSLLTAKRKELHQRIGLAIEDMHSQNIGEACQVLAGHFEKGGDFQRAAAYFKMAGAKAGDTGAIKESIDYAERTIACLERMPQNKDVLKNIVNVRTILGIRFMDMGHLNESHKIISPIIETASGLGHSRRIAQINIILGMYYFYIKEDFTTAFEYYDKALAESRSLNDAGLWAMANYWRGIPLSFNCDFNEAESCFVESGNVHQRAEEWIWLSIVKSFISHLVKYHQGEIDQAVQTGREVMRLAEKSGDIYSKLFAHCTLGTACYGIGDLDRAVDHFVAGLTIGERINHYFWNCHANHYLGDTYFELGDMQNAMNHYHKANGLFLEIGHMPSWARLNDLALRLTELNTEERPDFDPESLGDYSAANKLCVYDGLIKRRIGEIMMSLGRFEEAEHWIAQAVETHERHGMRFHLAGDYAVKAEQCKLGGDLSRGREHLVMARSIYKDCGAPGWVEIMDERLAAMA